MTQRLEELAARARAHGFEMHRWHDPANHPFNLETVVFALRRKHGQTVRVGSARDVARLLDALEERAAR